MGSDVILKVLKELLRQLIRHSESEADNLLFAA